MSKYPYAKDGNVYISEESEAHDGTDNLDQLAQYAHDIFTAISQAKTQRVEIEAKCADGHEWGDPTNNWHPEHPETMWYCAQPGCRGQKSEPGWLPFEPKQHPNNIWNRGQCTGPGCYTCGLQQMYDLINSAAPIQIRRGGIRFPTPPAMENAFQEAREEITNPNQHCTSTDCRDTPSHTAQFCGASQLRQCDCHWCYPERGQR